MVLPDRVFSDDDGRLLALCGGFGGIKLGKVRSLEFATCVGVIGAVVAVLAMHYFDYRQFLNVVERENPQLRDAWDATGLRGFFHYVTVAPHRA